MYKRDKQLEDLLTNKRVVVVGPSSHLVGKNLGSIIDSYDVVIRNNEFFPVGNEKDYGSKTTISSLNMATVSMPEFIYKYNLNIERTKQIKLFYCPTVKALGADCWQNWSDNDIGPVVSNFHSINTENIPFSWIGISNYRYFYNLVGTEPNTGITNILTALQYDIEELLIIGFSFYSQGITMKDCYYDGYIPKEAYTLENYPYSNFNPHLGHDQIKQRQFFRDYIIRNYSFRIKIDSFLDKSFCLNYGDVLDIGE